jgi:hypothetical protein
MVMAVCVHRQWRRDMTEILRNLILGVASAGAALAMFAFTLTMWARTAARPRDGD